MAFDGKLLSEHNLSGMSEGMANEPDIALLLITVPGLLAVGSVAI
jgi:hypothetical protein